MASLCNGLIMVVVLYLSWYQSATLTRHGCVWRLLARRSNILASLFVLKEVMMLLEEILHAFIYPGGWMVRVDYD